MRVVRHNMLTVVALTGVLCVVSAIRTHNSASAQSDENVLLLQSQADADRKSAGCLTCHTATDSPTMHSPRTSIEKMPPKKDMTKRSMAADILCAVPAYRDIVSNGQKPIRADPVQIGAIPFTTWTVLLPVYWRTKGARTASSAAQS